MKWLVHGSAKDLTNVAITRFAATTDGKSTMALVQLQNDTDKEQKLTLTLQNSKGDVLVDEPISLAANEAVSKSFKDLPLMDTVTAKINVKDDYAIDNIQSVVLQTATANIVVDQNMHQLIQKGFQAINDNVKIVPPLQLADNQGASIVTNQTSLLQKMETYCIIWAG
ncbi:VWFA domain-containing protein OS=Lysinibacillus sphaericus OX=1421 GN=LS41612_18835 PE=4 SV=1 [Lysinibacillus sphaericus]